MRRAQQLASKAALTALISVIICPSLSSAARTICGPNGAERIVEVVALEDGKKVPCEVRYTKTGAEAKVIFQAKTQAGFCEKKADEFIAHLKTLKLDCKAEQ